MLRRIFSTNGVQLNQPGRGYHSLVQFAGKPASRSRVACGYPRMVPKATRAAFRLDTPDFPASRTSCRSSESRRATTLRHMRAAPEGAIITVQAGSPFGVTGVNGPSNLATWRKNSAPEPSPAGRAHPPWASVESNVQHRRLCWALAIPLMPTPRA